MKRCLGAVPVFVVLAGACSKPLDPPPAPITITQATFEPVYRASKTIQGSTATGVTHVQFGELLQKFSTEIAIAKDKQMNELDKKLVAVYDEGLAAYQFSNELWKVKLESDEETWKGEIPVSIKGKTSPVIDAGVKKYGLKVTDRRLEYLGTRYQAVAGTAIQEVWSKADEILNRATEMYYGRSTKTDKS